MALAPQPLDQPHHAFHPTPPSTLLNTVVTRTPFRHLLPSAQRGAFTKEDGEQVIDAAGKRIGA